MYIEITSQKSDLSKPLIAFETDNILRVSQGISRQSGGRSISKYRFLFDAIEKAVFKKIAFYVSYT